MESEQSCAQWLDLLRKRMLSDELLITPTSASQSEVEERVYHVFERFFSSVHWDCAASLLHRHQHSQFLLQSLSYLPESYESLDASRPWLCFWILHSLSLLDHSVSSPLSERVVAFLGQCQCSSGGFGGGPGQLPHLAASYAAVNALCIIGTPAAFNIINRAGLVSFLTHMRREDGSFLMHEGGEVDIRGVYCAIVVSKLTNSLSPKLFHNTAEWVASCQTYEGGFSGCPELEAHGGYTYCGLASLTLLDKQHLCNLASLMRWVSNRQMMFEGGFSGRTNKLVDSCYSFWQGANFPLIHSILSVRGESKRELDGSWLYESSALQLYIIACCQHPRGGFIDKPGKRRDIYHTCYALSGLSLAQHCPPGCRQDESDAVATSATNVLGSERNLLEPVDPLYNLRVDHAQRAVSYFRSLPTCHL